MSPSAAHSSTLTKRSRERNDSDVTGGGVPGVWKRQAQWLTVGLTVTAIGLSACSSEDPDDRGTTSVPDVTTAVPEGDSPSPIDPVNGEPILIETHRTNISAGEVLPGSFIGDSPFCPGGRVRAEHGDPDLHRVGQSGARRLLTADGPFA